MGALYDFLVLLVIAGICGFFASQLMGARRMNVVMMIVVGFVGAVLGRYIAQFLHLPLLFQVYIGGHAFPLVWAIIGSIITVGIASSIQQH